MCEKCAKEIKGHGEKKKGKEEKKIRRKKKEKGKVVKSMQKS